MEYKVIEVIEKDNEYIVSNGNRSLRELKTNEVLIEVKYSSLNFKDGLSAVGNKGVTKVFPHVLGIDASGVVIESNSKLYNKGDRVIATGYDIGMNHDGGYAQYLIVDASWLVLCPDKLELNEAMVYGTAGLTAALCVNKLLKDDLDIKSHHVLISGAKGGVGSIALNIMLELGYKVDVLSTSNTFNDKRINEVIDTTEFIKLDQRAMQRPKYTKVIDVLGGPALSAALKSCVYNAKVSACGNALDGNLNTNVYPFILRGVTLYGIDSVNIDLTTRNIMWNLLSKEYAFKHELLDIKEVSLPEIIPYLSDIINNKVKQRILVKI